MLPDWMAEQENYEPLPDKNAFTVRTLRSLGGTLSRLQAQHGHEKAHAMPAAVKLVLLVGLVILVSATRSRLVLLAAAVGIHGYLAIWPAEDLPKILKPAGFAAFLALILFLPAMLINPSGAGNNLLLICKVFLSVEMLNIFNHTTQWNHITGAMRKLHIPGIFIFTLDITLKYIVLLGNLIENLLTALTLRSVGRNSKKYQSVGGVMGVTFLRSTEMSREMYEAMQCRGFTDDYKGM